MIMTTAFEIPGKKIAETLGMVKGNTVRARHLGHDFMAGLKNIVGGEITEYTKLMAESREQSIARMTADAEKLGTDAIIGTRFVTSAVTQGGAELLVYGTAVKFE